MDASAHFRGKWITVMGLGLLGRGVGDARYLAECGAELIVTDLKTCEELAESVAQLESFKNITFVLGEHRLEDFNNRDLILKAAGVPLDSIYIAEAKKNNIPVRMSADLFAEISNVTCISVTGTRGKSTVAHMIFHILKEAGKKVLLGGNVRGVSNLALLREATPEHTAVLELDSWQLQGWGSPSTKSDLVLGRAGMSPHIAVFATLYPDHLNYYKDRPEQYLADKANIFLFQKPGDTLILGRQCAPAIIEKYGDKIESKTLVVDETKLPDTWTLCIPGLHNRYNAALALTAARTIQIPDDINRHALETFKGVPGRLELIREANGVKIYNDNSSTTPEATIAALRAVGDADNRRVILILGGDEKNLDMSGLIDEIPKWCSKVVLFKERGTNRIRDEVFALVKDGLEVYEEEGLEATVRWALSLATPCDTILYSPAFSSFGKYFKNEYDRGDQFVALIKKHTS